SSRRRHTRFSRDWSSDVCSSDLIRPRKERARFHGRKAGVFSTANDSSVSEAVLHLGGAIQPYATRGTSGHRGERFVRGGRPPPPPDTQRGEPAHPRSGSKRRTSARPAHDAGGDHRRRSATPPPRPADADAHRRSGYG